MCAMDNQKEREIRTAALQRNLVTVRNIAGWTAEMLGNKIGVTKQTISNIETMRATMSYTQYIAIRAVIDAEIDTLKNKDLLKQLLKVAVDDAPNYSEDEQDQVMAVGFAAAQMSKKGMSSAAVAGLVGGVLGISALVLPTVGVAALDWLKKDKKDKK